MARIICDIPTSEAPTDYKLRHAFLSRTVFQEYLQNVSETVRQNGQVENSEISEISDIFFRDF